MTTIGPDMSRLLARKAYGELKEILARTCLESLAEAWSGLAPMEQLAGFRLLGPERAMAFFARLPRPEKYFLFCGFPLACLAPLTEGVPASARPFFLELPRWCQEKMLDGLLKAEAA